MKTRKYEYLISYHHRTGTGTSYVTRTKKIESINDAMEVTKHIESLGKASNVGILNIVLLREYKEEV